MRKVKRAVFGVCS